MLFIGIPLRQVTQMEQPTTRLPRGRRWQALIALAALLLFDLPTHAACLVEGGVQPVSPFPTVTWLRSWRADLATPARLAVDARGRVAIADPARARVLVRNADGSLAFAIAAGQPVAVAAAASGGWWIGDGRSGRVSLYAADGTEHLSLGAGDGEFGQPGDIAVDPANGEVFVSDTARQVVTVYSSAGAHLRTIGAPAPADDLPAGDGQFRTPTGIVLAGQELLVADQLNYRVQAFDKVSGAFLYCLGSYSQSSFIPPSGGPSRTFGMAQGLAVDALGRLYVADAFQGQVRVLDRTSGAVLASIGAFGDEPGALRTPSDVVIDGTGRLFVASTAGARIDVYGLDAFADPERFAPASISVAPPVIVRPPRAVDTSIEIPGYRATDIDPASVRINGLTASALGVEDRDGNGIPELRMTLDGAALLPTLGAGTQGTVEVTGSVGSLQFAATATVAIEPPVGPTDADGDGVSDALDACPGTPAGDAVDAAGCALAQLCPCEGPPGGGAWRNHGDYVRCVAATTSLRSGGEAVRLAARSACGRSR
jgi:DNA-binding beta-propeller fold protein YncE